MDGINFYDRIYTCKKSFNNQAHTVGCDELIKKIEPFFEKMGFVRFADVTGMDRIGIPVVNAIRPFKNGISVSHGKGISLEAATASALMESVERFYGSTSKIPYFKTSYNSLKDKTKVISFENIPLLKDSIFNSNTMDLWTKGWDIVNKEETAVPLSLVTMSRKPFELDSFFRSTNGLAGSIDFLEAVSQALIEVIERDATANSSMAARYKKSFTLLKRVRLETIKFDNINKLFNKIEKANILPVLFDCTIDTEVPTYECQLIDLKEPDFLLCKGMGSSLSVETAMQRAITEAVQARAVSLSGTREAFFMSEIFPVRLSSKQQLLSILTEEQDKKWEWVSADIHQSTESESFEQDINLCMDKLKNIGFNSIIVVDLTMGNCNFHVVRVIVPGLEGVDDLMYYSPGKRAKEFLKGKTA